MRYIPAEMRACVFVCGVREVHYALRTCVSVYVFVWVCVCVCVCGVCTYCGIYVIKQGILHAYTYTCVYIWHVCACLYACIIGVYALHTNYVYKTCTYVYNHNAQCVCSAYINIRCTYIVYKNPKVDWISVYLLPWWQTNYVYITCTYMSLNKSRLDMISQTVVFIKPLHFTKQSAPSQMTIYDQQYCVSVPKNCFELLKSRIRVGNRLFCKLGQQTWIWIIHDDCDSKVSGLECMHEYMHNTNHHHRLCVYKGGSFSVTGCRSVPPPAGEPHALKFEYSEQNTYAR